MVLQTFNLGINEASSDQMMVYRVKWGWSPEFETKVVPCLGVEGFRGIPLHFEYLTLLTKPKLAGR